MSVENAIETWMIFEVLAAEEDAAVESLEDHVNQLASMDTIEITSKEFDSVEEVDDPHPSLDTGYSQVCEIEADVDGFPNLIKIVMNYGPTLIEINGPESIELDLNEMQDSLNLVAEMMQKFLKSGAGGMMISRPEEMQG